MDNIFQDNIPDQMVVCMVDSESYNGHSEKNPFNFQNFRLSYMEFTVNGVSNESYLFQPRFRYTYVDDQGHVKWAGVDDFNQSYMSLFPSAWSRSCEIPNITDIDFSGGYCIHKFDLNNKELSFVSTPMRKGQTRLSLKFAATLQAPVTVLAYGIFNSLLKVDESRNINIQI